MPLRCLILLTLLFGACHKHPQTQNPKQPPLVPAPREEPAETGTTNVAISPYDFISPFICSMTQQQVVCMASVNVHFRRGQAEIEIQRGYQFSFSSPKGKGRGSIWFGCAGVNECGPGYFMLGSPTITVTPAEPARFWNSGSETLVPYGSLGIAEVDVSGDQFVQLRNRWAGAIAPPILKAGTGTVVTCTDQACTVSVK